MPTRDELGSTQLITPSELADFLRKTRGALAVERCQRRDTPPWIKIGRKILYRKEDVLAWLEAHSVSPASGLLSGSDEHAKVRDDGRRAELRQGRLRLDSLHSVIRGPKQRRRKSLRESGEAHGMELRRPTDAVE
jgi:hypothetical protein